MEKQKLIEHILKSDLTASEKRYLEELVHEQPETELYTCEYCGFVMDWNKVYPKHGEIWTCESCFKAFCSGCAEKFLGAEKYKIAMIDWDLVFCPECAEKILNGEKKVEFLTWRKGE